MDSNTNVKGYSLVWWLFSLFGIPITIPWFIYHFIKILKKRRQRMTLNKQVVIITGASSGLGEALAHAFYQCGCRIVLVARRKEELERVKNTLMQTHCNGPTYPPIVLPLDLTQLNLIPEAIERVLSIYNQIDILVNNAGISYRGEAAKTDINVDIRVMQINYFAQIALAKAVLQTMIEQQSGHVVCISSVQGKIAIPHRSAYAASKHALQAWCDSARAELSDKNINVTVINPGYIKTDLSLNAVTDNGDTYGIMEKNTEDGYSPSYVADQVLSAVLCQNEEIMIAPLIAKAAHFIRYMFPSLYFMIMKRRAKKTGLSRNIK